MLSKLDKLDQIKRISVHLLFISNNLFSWDYQFALANFHQFCDFSMDIILSENLSVK